MSVSCQNKLVELKTWNWNKWTFNFFAHTFIYSLT